MKQLLYDWRDATIEKDLVQLYNNLHLREKKWYPQEIQIMCKNNPMYLNWCLMMMAETRDIEYGKGERESTYHLFEQWLDIHPEMALETMKKIIPKYGCWKDIKYLCQRLYVKSPQHPMIASLLQLLNNDTASSVKWIPREKSAYRQFYHYLAVDWNMRILGKPASFPLKSMYKTYRQHLAWIKKHNKGDEDEKDDEKDEKDDWKKAVDQVLKYGGTPLTQQELSCIENQWNVKECWINTILIIDLISVSNNKNKLDYGIICRFIKNNQYPRCWVIKNNQAKWLNFGKEPSLEEIIQKIQEEERNEKEEKKEEERKGIFEAIHTMQKYLSKELIEKMTWVIMTDMNQYDQLPCKIQQGFMPHIVYLNHSEKEWPGDVNCVDRLRTTIYPITRKGLTFLQWEQIKLVNRDKNIRQFTSLQNILAILYNPRYTL